ncbi:MAG: Nif3-like dinuclear metal center hexameric protein [Acidimicrobiia bacterium]|nr:Nif3-like dinuclear metal center hexameric protein [Acidimicrobiia bacterium]
MQLSEFLKRMARETVPDRAASWDAVGIQVGDLTAELTTVTAVHEVTEEITAKLEAHPVDLVVSYHPLLFRPVRRLVPGRSPGGRATRLLVSRVAVAVTHTDFDAMPGGTADALAEEIGLKDITVFGPMAGRDTVKMVTFVPEKDLDRVVTALAEAGAGVIGNYRGCSYRSTGEGSFFAGEGTTPVKGQVGQLNLETETRLEMIAPAQARSAVMAALVSAHPYEEPAFDVYEVESNHGFVGRVGAWQGDWQQLVSVVMERLGSEGVRVAPLDGEVSAVAVVPGSGSSLIAAARASGADALVTGDMSHHAMVEANDAGLAVIDAGHAPTEKPGMRRLRRLVADIGPEYVDIE